MRSLYVIGKRSREVCFLTSNSKMFFVFTVISKSGAGQLDLLILDALYKVSSLTFNCYLYVDSKYCIPCVYVNYDTELK